MWPLVAFALTAGSTLLSGRAAQKGAREQEALAKQQAMLERRRGASEKQARYFTAKQLRVAAGQQEAIGRLAATDERRKSEILQSRALAVAGASGAGISDPDVLRIMADLAKEGELAAETREFEGQDAAAKLRLNARLSEWEGDRLAEGAGLSADSFNRQASALGKQVNAIGRQTLLDIAGSAVNAGSKGAFKL